MLFALQGSSRQVRALLTLVFVFQGKRFNSKVCNRFYSGWQRCSSVSCGPQLSLGSCWSFCPAGKGSGPVSLAKVRQSSQLPFQAASTIPAPAQGSALLQRQQQDPCVRKAMHTWRLLLPPCWGCCNPHYTRLLILQVIYSFLSSVWPFYKALPCSCSALALTDLSDHLSSPFITCPPSKIML